MITKIYFPRIFLPASSIISGILDFSLSFIILICMMGFYNIEVTWNIVFLPLFVLLAIICSLAVGLWLSALNVRYRDVKYVLPFLIQVWHYATPIVYSTTLIPENWRLIYSLNPMVGVVNGFRWALLGQSFEISSLFIISIVVVTLFFFSSLIIFQRMEQTFADFGVAVSNYSIQVENLGKKYQLRRGKRRVMLRQVLENTVRSGVENIRRIGEAKNDAPSVTLDQTFWALKDISFKVEAGESVGIIGSNGAGKSTLLKILSRVTLPTKGHARIRGRVGSLLEVGTGFHPELTGRENVYLNGSILGMPHREIEQKFDEIVAFSEIEEFLDVPVKFYSSGMKLRLAFSVATHLDPDILLVDEILAVVGDAAFQKKSLSKMKNVVRDGRTVLCVSHNLATIRSFCNRGIYIQEGRMKFIGSMSDAINIYLDSGAGSEQPKFNAVSKPNLAAQVLEVEIANDGLKSNQFPHDQALLIKIKAAINKPLYQSSIGLSVLDNELNPVFTSYDFEQNAESLQTRERGIHSYHIEIPPILAPGDYRLSVLINRKRRRKGVKTLDAVENICPFEIYDNGSSRAQKKYKMGWLFYLSL